MADATILCNPTTSGKWWFSKKKRKKKKEKKSCIGEMEEAREWKSRSKSRVVVHCICMHARTKLQRRPVKFGGRQTFVTRMRGSVQEFQINGEPEAEAENENAAADCRLVVRRQSCHVRNVLLGLVTSSSSSSSRLHLLRPHDLRRGS